MDVAARNCAPCLRSVTDAATDFSLFPSVLRWVFRDYGGQRAAPSTFFVRASNPLSKRPRQPCTTPHAMARHSRPTLPRPRYSSHARPMPGWPASAPPDTRDADTRRRAHLAPQRRGSRRVRSHEVGNPRRPCRRPQCVSDHGCAKAERLRQGALASGRRYVA